MNIQKNPKNGLLKTNCHFSDDYMNFMYRVIKIYSIISNGENLTQAELVWFCCFVYIHNKGIENHLSEDALQIYKNLLGYESTKLNVSNYFKRVKDKEWLVVREGKMIMPEFFSKIDVDSQVIDFEIRLTTNDNK